MFQSGRKRVISSEKLFVIKLKMPSLVTLNPLLRKRWMIEFSVQAVGANLMRILPRNIFQVVYREIRGRQNDYFS